MYEVINAEAKKLNQSLMTANIHSGDPFYRVDPGIAKIASDNNCVAAEMEAFALFANAKYFRKTAACLLTVSDIIPARKMITAEEREKSLDKMTKLALESAVAFA